MPSSSTERSDGAASAVPSRSTSRYIWARSSFTRHDGQRVSRAKSSSLKASTIAETRSHSSRRADGRTLASSEELLAFSLLHGSGLATRRDGGVGEHAERLLELLVGDHEREEMPKDVVVDAAGDGHDAALLRLLHER